MSNDQDWPWDQPKNAMALTTTQVMSTGAPILRVTHYEDDHSWAFVCGTTEDMKDVLTVLMEHVVNDDPTLAEIADLEPGWTAYRDAVGAPWERQKDSAEDDDEMDISFTLEED